MWKGYAKENSVTCYDHILMIRKSHTFLQSKLFIAVLHMVTIQLLCMFASSQLKPDRKDLVWYWPKGSAPAFPPLHISICPSLLISSSMALLRSRQVVLTLKKQYPCREQPAQAWPPSLVLSISSLISWPWYWKAGRLLQPTFVWRN